MNDNGYLVALPVDLRDYFAAKALVIIPVQGAYNTQDNEGWGRYTARQAYHLADAMLKERSKK